MGIRLCLRCVTLLLSSSNPWIFSTDTPNLVAYMGESLSEKGILIDVVGSRRIRLVTHYWISDVDVDTTINVLREVMKEIA